MAGSKRFHQFRPHPWHGLEAGPDPPRIVTAYIEISPFDTVKYEIDKRSGYLKVDRPQRGAAQPPTLYGFIPRTYCGAEVAKLSSGRASAATAIRSTSASSRSGPMDRAEILLERARRRRAAA